MRYGIPRPSPASLKLPSRTISPPVGRSPPAPQVARTLPSTSGLQGTTVPPTMSTRRVVGYNEYGRLNEQNAWKREISARAPRTEPRACERRSRGCASAGARDLLPASHRAEPGRGPKGRNGPGGPRGVSRPRAPVRLAFHEARSGRGVSSPS